MWPSRESVPWLVNRASSTDGPRRVSLPASPLPRAWRALLQQMFREHEGWGPFSPLCAFQGLALVCFSGFDLPCQERGVSHRPSGPSSLGEATSGHVPLPQQQLPPSHLGPLHL